MPGWTPSAAGPVPSGLPQQLAGLRRTAVMGVLNVTPDSFSDGGRYVQARPAVVHARAMLDAGADIIDVGGESTRPGAERVLPEVEQERVLPVVEAVAALGVPVSIDTMSADTARLAVRAGAVLVNDVSGGLADAGMLDALAELGTPCVLMHWRGHSSQMARLTDYRDVVEEVAEHLRQRVDAAVAAGVRRDRIAVDPGLGFAKEHDHNWALLAALDRLAPGLPLLVGASRKRFLGALLADGAGDRPAGERDAATASITALAAAAGAWCVRVHDVRPSADAVRVVQAWRSAQGSATIHRAEEGMP